MACAAVVQVEIEANECLFVLHGNGLVFVPTDLFEFVFLPIDLFE